MFAEKLDSSWVCLKSWDMTVCGEPSRFTSTTIRIPSRSDSSRMSLTSVSFLAPTWSAIFSIRVVLLTWYGSSVITTAIRPGRISSNATWPRITIRPRPVAYMCRMASIRSFSPAMERWSA